MQEIVFHVSGSKLGFWIPFACNLSKFIKVKTQQRLFKKQIKPFPIESLTSKKDPPPVRKTNDGYLSTRSLSVVWYISLVNINSAPVSHKTQQPPVGEKLIVYHGIPLIQQRCTTSSAITLSYVLLYYKLTLKPMHFT